jgi:hypothetical protein
MSGRQSTMERPDPVSRVTPPRTTIAKTSPQHIRSQVATARFCACRVVSMFIYKSACLFLHKASNLNRTSSRIAASQL